MKAKLLLQQADAGLRELSPGEKGRCLADLTLLKLSEQAVETERAACEDTPDYRAALAKAEQDTAVAMQKREDFIKNHQEEIRENYKKLYPDRKNNGDFETQYDLLYGAPDNIIRWKRAVRCSSTPTALRRPRMGRTSSLAWTASWRL